MDRAPSGWIRCRCGFESSLFKSSARRPFVEVYVPASRIDRKNAKVNAIKFSPGEAQKDLGPYFAVFTVKKTKYTPPNAYLAAPKFAFDGPALPRDKI